MIHKANSGTIKYAYKGRVYTIYDAFEKPGAANSAAKGLNTLQGRIHQNTRTLAIVVDLGKEAGRLRYAVFTTRGGKL